MPKRYHHGKHEGHHSKHHDSHHSTHHTNEHYAGHEGRRHQEMKDAGMIHNDYAAVANMPQNVMYHSWTTGESKHYLPEPLDDTARGIEHQKDMDGMKMMGDYNPKKV